MKKLLLVLSPIALLVTGCEKTYDKTVEQQAVETTLGELYKLNLTWEVNSTLTTDDLTTKTQEVHQYDGKNGYVKTTKDNKTESEYWVNNFKSSNSLKVSKDSGENDKWITQSYNAQSIIQQGAMNLVYALYELPQSIEGFWEKVKMNEAGLFSYVINRTEGSDSWSRKVEYKFSDLRIYEFSIHERNLVSGTNFKSDIAVNISNVNKTVLTKQVPNFK